MPVTIVVPPGSASAAGVVPGLKLGGLPVGAAGGIGVVPAPTIKVLAPTGSAQAAGIPGVTPPSAAILHRRPLTALGERMRDSLPPVLRESPDYLAVIHALSKECERVAGMIEVARAQLNPAHATVLLGVWERITRQTVAPAGKTEVERQMAILARLRKMLSLGQGKAWEDQITAVIGPGWTYEEHDVAKPSGPPEGTIRIKLPFEPSGSRYSEALSAIREVTHAHLEIQFENAAGFLLDASALDLELLSI